MKIAFDLQVCQSTETAFRGIGRYSLDFATAVLSNFQKNHEFLAVLNQDLQMRQGHIQAALNLPQQQYRYLTGNSLFPEIHAQRRFYSRLQNHLYAQEKCDIIHNSSIFEYTSTHIPHFFPASTERIYSATLYDLIPLRMRNRYLPNRSSLNWYLEYARSLERQTVLLAISEATRKEALELLQLRDDQVFNISSAVDPTKFYSETISEALRTETLQKYSISKPFILYTAGFDARKNMDGLIKAYAKLPISLRQAYQLVIVCSKPEGAAEEIKRWCKEAGIPDTKDVIFTGFVPDEDLRRLYNLTALFVFPSLYEGFGLPIVEAIRCGAPAIGSDCSSIIEILDRSDLRFNPNDPDSIAEKIYQVLSDKSFRKNISDFETRHIQKFSWDNVAKRAMEAWATAKKQLEDQKIFRCSLCRKTYADRPKLALFTPVPGQKSGIADFTGRLIQILSTRYEIEIFANASEDIIKKAKQILGIPVHSHLAFPKLAEKYDLNLYQVGNNALHQYMFPYIRNYPGIVELHDFYIGHSLQSIPCNPAERLAAEHGIEAVLKIPDLMPDQEKTVWEYPYCHWIFEQPTVILHSKFAKSLAESFFPQGFPADVRTISLPIRIPPLYKEAGMLRKKLNLPQNCFLIASLGMVSPLKKVNLLIEAFRILKQKYPAREIALVFGGDLLPGFEPDIDPSIQNRVFLTGYLNEQEYWGLIRDSDLVVQLREKTRGESSGTIQDIMAIGRPMILNDHGSFRDYPSSCTYKVPDECTEKDLVITLMKAMNDPSKEIQISAQRHYIQEHCSESKILALYEETINEMLRSSESKNKRRICSATVKEMRAQGVSDLCGVARQFPHYDVRSNRQRILLDISLFVQHNYRTGIQRVVSNITDILCTRESPEVFLPVALRGDKLFYCRYNSHKQHYEYACEWEAQPRDLLLLLDSSWVYKDLFLPILEEIHNWGGVAYSILYDILPIQKPELFPSETLAVFQPWLHHAIRHTDGFVCISRSVANELKEYILQGHILPKEKILPVGHFYLGSDFLTEKIESHTSELPDCLKNLPQTARIFLSVGTIEPRKNHSYMLRIMEHLWAEQIPAVWIIAGKEGWKTKEWLKALFRHPEYGKKLFYLPRVNDETLRLLYKKGEFLYQLSLGEGYGLPLLEASALGMRVLCSDIPVFHEIDQEKAFVFCPLSSEIKTAEIIKDLLRGDSCRTAARSAQERFTWQYSAEMLLDCILRNQWDFTLSN